MEDMNDQNKAGSTPFGLGAREQIQENLLLTDGPGSRLRAHALFSALLSLLKPLYQVEKNIRYSL